MFIIQKREKRMNRMNKRTIVGASIIIPFLLFCVGYSVYTLIVNEGFSGGSV